eukprot:TRINITY_DN3363_c0_g2_i2.p1 TRINITY_DN3363_c0_g2~~TRINITY_DN3363_c0_g2_i2.p1  ORF type:complete len:580 (+),score=197.59 TRINITY_DN3363_c0_g2_i2:265-2004(+)
MHSRSYFVDKSTLIKPHQVQTNMDGQQFLSSELSSHLTDILATILKEKPNDGLRLFEALSAFSRTGKMVPDADANVYVGEDTVSKPLITAAELSNVEWAKMFSEMVIPPKPVKKIPKGEEEEEAEPEPEEAPEDKGELADIVSEQQVFNALGMGLNESEAYRIMVSLKRLLDKQPLKSVRFFGKILATKCNYYIAETEVDPDREPEQEDADAGEAGEEEGQEKGPETILEVLHVNKGAKQPRVPAEAANQLGANRYRYWVTTDLCNWTRLPDVKPEHIQAARLIKKLFTGDLTAPVQCHPPFPGSEQEYLRAQIARISHACKISPKGMFEAPAEEEEEEEDAPPKTTHKRAPYEQVPEITPASAEELPDQEDEAWAKETFAMWGRGYPNDALLVPKNWIHIEPALLQTQGRTCEHKFPPPEGEEEEEEVEGAAKLPIELINPMCSDLSLDDKISYTYHTTKEHAPWSVRKAASQPSQVATQSFLIRSLRWPGACCYAQINQNVPGAQFCNTYIGNGLKAAGTATFAPPTPNVVSVPPPKEPLLQTDYTPDDELEFAPPPPPPTAAKPEEEEEEEEEDDK